MYIMTTEQMKKLEDNAALLGVDHSRLMENAGSAAAKNITVLAKNGIRNKNIAILCGKGNNGGDACVVARKLFLDNANVTLIMTSSIPSTKQSYAMYERVKQTSVEVLQVDFDLSMIIKRIQRADILIDGVYGTGFSGEITEKIAEIFCAYNLSYGEKFSLDIPSGVNANTGQVAENAIEADYTITFGAYKTGQFVTPGKEHCGNLILADIAIPQKAFEISQFHAKITERDDMKKWLKPRKQDCNKGDFGKALLVCGSVGMSGAAVLATKSALRCGTGLVTLATPKTLVMGLSSLLVENTMLPLEENEQGAICGTNDTILLKRVEKSSACLIGCGISLCEDTKRLVYLMIENCEKPLIIDADGINAISENINILKAAKNSVIITPHPGEMARLIKSSVLYVQENRINIAESFAKEYNVTVVLKGYETIIATPNGEIYVNPTGNAGLAKGGSGDVLAGIITAFVSQGYSSLQSAVMGTYIHGEAADICKSQLGETFMLASDVIDNLSIAFRRLDR